MTDERRLEAILAQLRDTPGPAIACDAHAAQIATLADPTAPLDIDALVAAVDCPECAAVLDAHPVLHSELLDLPVPPPVVTPSRRRIPWPALALAAAILLFAWAVFRPSPPVDVSAAPGPVAEGHASYAFAELTGGGAEPGGPHIEGRASYTWVERPVHAEDYHFRHPDLGPIAMNHTYSPWAWR
jgi:hypothetical protein